jgi:hypothetical protein
VHQGIEMKCASPDAVELLYYELAFNLAYSFYPVELADAVDMAALVLRIEKGDDAKQGDIKSEKILLAPGPLWFCV